MVVFVAMLSVNYLPDKLFQDFPYEPRTIEPNDYDSVIPQWNNLLSDGKPEFIQLNNLLGPESLAISREGLIYTGLADGRLVELDPAKNYKLRTVLRHKGGADCPDDVATRADKCGRYLQLRFLNDSLYAVEANSGLYKIDRKAGTKSFVGPKALTKVNLYNSFAFDPKTPNLVYLTVSSTKWDLLNIMWSISELDNSGRLLVLDVKTGKRAVVLDNILTPNGVDVDPERDQLVYSETIKSRVMSVPLKDIRAAFEASKDGDKLANIGSRALIPLMPGHPDNIVVHGNMAYIALPMVKDNGKDLVDSLNQSPSTRKAISRLSFGLGKVLEYVYVNLYQHPLLETAFRELKCGHVNYRVLKSDKSAVVEYNLATGSSRFLGSSTFGFVSEAHPDGKGNLYLGSFRSSFIVKQKI